MPQRVQVKWKKTDSSRLVSILASLVTLFVIVSSLLDSFCDLPGSLTTSDSSVGSVGLTGFLAGGREGGDCWEGGGGPRVRAKIKPGEEDDLVLGLVDVVMINLEEVERSSTGLAGASNASGE